MIMRGLVITRVYKMADNLHVGTQLNLMCCIVVALTFVLAALLLAIPLRVDVLVYGDSC